MSDKVVSIFAKGVKKDEPKVESKTEETFEEVAERNRKNKERIEKERLAANKGVLRSYRIKH